MKALFIGGTGTISTEITKLLASGTWMPVPWEMYLLNRGTRNNRLPEGLPIHYLTCDIYDEKAVEAVIKDMHFDTVVNFINFDPAQVERDIRLFAGRTKQYIFISSASAYQKPPAHYLITESTPLANPFWTYSQKKIACEERLMTEYRQKGFPITIVRPSHTYDYNALPVGIHGQKGAWQVLKRMREGKPVLVPGDGTSLWTITHSRDFARGFAGLMGNIHAIGEAVHITSDESVTWNQVYTAIANALGVAPNLCHVTADFLAACDPYFAGPLHGDKANSVVFDNSKIKRLSPGFTATIRYDQGIQYSVSYYLANAEMQQDDEAFDRFTDTVVRVREAAVEMVMELMGQKV